MKRMKKQKLSSKIRLQGRRFLALLIVAAMMFSMISIGGFGDFYRVEAALDDNTVDQSTPTAKRAVLDTFEVMKNEYKIDLSANRGTMDNPILILEIVPEYADGELGYTISGCEPIDMKDQLTLKAFKGNDSIAVIKGGGGDSEISYFFPDEPEYQKMIDANINSPQIKSDGKELSGYYERVSDGTGVFEFDGTDMVEAVSGNYIWHTINNSEKEVLNYNADDLNFADVLVDVTSVGDRIYTKRTNTDYIRGEYYYFVNSDNFLLSALGLGKAEAKNTSVIVKTITTDELNKYPDWVTYSDLIYISHHGHYPAMQTAWVSHPKVIPSRNGLSAAVVESRGIQGFDKTKVDDITGEVALKIFLKSISDELFAGVILDDQVFNTPSVYTSHSLNISVLDNMFREMKKDDGTTYYYTDTGYKENMMKLMIMLQSMDPYYFNEIYCRGTKLDLSLNSDGSPADTFGTITIGEDSYIKFGDDANKTLFNDLRDESGDNPVQSYWGLYTFRLIPSASYVKLFYSNNPYSYWTSDEAWSLARIYGPITSYKYLVDGHVMTFPSENSMTINFLKNFPSDTSLNGDFGSWFGVNRKNDTHDKIWTSDAIGYILGLHSRSHTIVDLDGADIRVLDIEPSVKTETSTTCYNNKETWTFDEEAVRGLLKIKESEDVNIQIDHLTTAGFNCNIKDLNSNYDMIYLGLDVGGYRFNGTKIAWNDAKMGNLIITHSGDRISAGSNTPSNISTFVNGYMDWTYEGDELKTLSYKPVTIGNTDYNVRGYFANDITSVKYKQLYDFAIAGKPIVADYMLYNCDGYTGVSTNTVHSATPNKKYIDINSFYYKLATTLKANPIVSGNTVGFYNEFQPDEIRGAINDNQSVNISIEPLFSDYVGTKNANTAELNSQNFLPVEGAASVARWNITAPSGYYYKLYIDVNQDSKFRDADDECVQEGFVNSSNPPEKYFSDTDIGMHGWRIVVYEPSHPEKYVSKEGFCATRRVNGADPVELYVLQIKSSLWPNTSGGLDLTNNTTYKKYFDALTDYKIEVVSCTYKEYQDVFRRFTESTGHNFSFDSSKVVSSNNPADLSELKKHDEAEAFKDIKLKACNGKEYYMSHFNMLLLGFGDSGDYQSQVYFDNKYGELDFIKYWIALGKGILFCHDLSHYRNKTEVSNPSDVSGGNGAPFAYAVNYYLRDDMGMNSYGVVSKFLKNKAAGKDFAATEPIITKSIENSKIGFTKLYEYNSETDQSRSPYVQGYTVGCLNKISYGANTPYATMSKLTSGGNLETTTIQMTNKGQITHYPYLVVDEGEEFVDIKKTHYQYYSVNLEDENTTVWYNLATNKNATDDTKFYGVNPKDGANNYYIFSRKNVFYSGVGHTMDNTEPEVRLFVNTMIAAYRAGEEAPTIFLTGDDQKFISSKRDVDGDDIHTTKYYRMQVTQIYDNASDTSKALEDGSTYKIIEFKPVEFASKSTKLSIRICFEDIEGNKSPVKVVYDSATDVPIECSSFSDEYATYDGKLKTGNTYYFYYRTKWAQKDWETDSITDPVSDSVLRSESQGKVISRAMWDIHNDRAPLSVSYTELKITLEPLFMLD